MFEYPDKFTIVSGMGEAKERLVAFDNALISAGISNYNLLRVSSILPVNCMRAGKIDKREGSVLLTAYGTISSKQPGEKIASAVSVGIPRHSEDIGVIMEYSGVCSKEEAESTVREMAREAMINHGILCKEILSSSIEKIVQNNRYAAVISAIAMW